MSRTRVALSHLRSYNDARRRRQPRQCGFKTSEADRVATLGSPKQTPFGLHLYWRLELLQKLALFAGVAAGH